MSNATAATYDPANLDWGPLESLARVGLVDPAEWMWMSATLLDDGRTLQAYKHCDTRLYLVVDNAGHTVTPSTSGYVTDPAPIIPAYERNHS